MTPADEATFIALWHEGLETAAIAARLDIPRTQQVEVRWR